MKPYVFPDCTIDTFRDNIVSIVEAYNEYGVVIFPGLLNSDQNFRQYVNELGEMLDSLIGRKLDRNAHELEMGDKLTLLASLQPILGKVIAGLGTQHNKLSRRVPQRRMGR
jgi:hypothetical protein